MTLKIKIFIQDDPKQFSFPKTNGKVTFKTLANLEYAYGEVKLTNEFRSKIEKVPRGIRGEKSSKDMASSRNLVSTIGALASPKMGTEPGVRKGKRSLLAFHTRCKCSMETTHNR